MSIGESIERNSNSKLYTMITELRLGAQVRMRDASISSVTGLVKQSIEPVATVRSLLAYTAAVEDELSMSQYLSTIIPQAWTSRPQLHLEFSVQRILRLLFCVKNRSVRKMDHMLRVSSQQRSR